MLSDWSLLLSWAQQGKAEAHFGEAGVTNLLHLLRAALTKATGGQLLASGGGGGAHKAARGERQQAQVGRACARCCSLACLASRPCGVALLAMLRPTRSNRSSLHSQPALPQASARQDATLVLMKELPTLLRKLHTDPVQARHWGAGFEQAECLSC